ncbi:UDP-galactose translocator-like [Saccostrea echinata]|uniref:UDP-galactose translocator-like n=1 Tax=Saccostrea echinata TaxID=191078 RepID=UPI002A83BD6F|nr:UDP-galactose translocator-like [Saccostrea echinata]
MSGQTERKTNGYIDTQSQETAAYLKYFSLVTLMLQNAVFILMMRYVRTRPGDMFMSTTAVIMSEVLKFLACFIIIFYKEGGMKGFLSHLNENIIKQPMDFLKISVPSIIYTLQNNLLFVAVSNLDAAVFQVTYQLKILTTALFSVIMLGKPLSRLQWVSLFILFCGVALVQVQPTGSSQSKVPVKQNPLLGLIAVLVQCCLSGFAGVYFEKILKGTKQSIWLRNFELGMIGAIIGFITMELNDGQKVAEKGFFFGYDYVVWTVICLQSFGGLVVAIVVKYADNILKGFATSGAIIISCIAAIYFFDFHLSLQFFVGASLVIISVFMYSKFVPQKPPAFPPATQNV